MTSLRLLSAALLIAAGTTAAFAGASSVPANYQPDPALKKASRGELEARVRKACAVTQAKLQKVSEPSLSGPCGCYAARTVKALDPAELQAYRDTGVFNDGARAKAIASLDACRLQRPI